MGASVGQQGAGRGTILAVLGLLAAATTGYFFAVPGGSTGGIIFKEGSAAGSPAAGERVVYAKTTGIYEKNSAGTETLLAGGTQGGTTGATTNAIVKATSANTLGDTSLTEASGVITATADVAPGITAGTVSSGTTGKNITLTGSAAKAASGANGGGIVLIGGAGDGGGYRNGVHFGGIGAGWPWLRGSNTDYIELFKGDASAYGELRLATLDITAGYTNATNYAADQAGGSFVCDHAGGTGQFKWYTSAYDTGLGRAAAGVVKATDGDTGLGWIQDAGRDYATADQTVDSTTLTADDTISLTLKAGRKYKFTLVYFFTPGDTVADGLKFDMAGGTATMTGFEARVRVVDNVGQDVSVTNSRMTALNTAVSLTGNQPATSFTMYVDGFAEVNAAGTLIPEFAKSADAGTGVVKKKYSQIEALDYP